MLHEISVSLDTVNDRDKRAAATMMVANGNEVAVTNDVMYEKSRLHPQSHSVPWQRCQQPSNAYVIQTGCAVDCRDMGNMPQRQGYFWTESFMDTPSSNDLYEDTSFSSMFSNPEDTLCRLTPMSDSMDYPLTTIIPTAASKQTMFSTGISTTWQRDWMDKPVKQWSLENVMSWIMFVIDEQEKLNFEQVKMHEFSVDGMTLCSMSEQDFIDRDPKFGSVLYRALQQQRMNDDSRLTAYERMHQSYLPPFGELKHDASELFNPNLDEHILADLDVKPRLPYLHSDTDSEHSISYSADKIRDDQERNMLKKKRGRPVGNRSKRKQEKKCGRLWEFIRDLLLKPEYCPSLICWENHDEGIFRFVRSDKVAELWGTIKDNPKMTYEKLSRAMRNYYASRILEPVPKTGRYPKKLVYKFGPAAVGWCKPTQNFV